jgi:hypothetical protein
VYVCIYFYVQLISLTDLFNENDKKVKKTSPCTFLTEHRAIKVCWGSGGILPSILDLGTIWEVSGHLHAPAALSPEKEPLVPIGQQAGLAPEPVWTRW